MTWDLRLPDNVSWTTTYIRSTVPMYTQCTLGQLHFHALGHREVIARFDSRQTALDDGEVLLREMDIRLGLMVYLARCFGDYRKPNSVEQPVRSLMGKRDLMGARLVRHWDRGCLMTTASSLNLLNWAALQRLRIVTTDSARSTASATPPAWRATRGWCRRSNGTSTGPGSCIAAVVSPCAATATSATKRLRAGPEPVGWWARRSTWIEDSVRPAGCKRKRAPLRRL